MVEQQSVEQRFHTLWMEEEIQRAEALRELLVRCYGALARLEALHLRLTPEAFALFQTERAAMYQRKRASISAAERSLAALFHPFGRTDRIDTTAGAPAKGGTPGLPSLNLVGNKGGDRCPRPGRHGEPERSAQGAAVGPAAIGRGSRCVGMACRIVPATTRQGQPWTPCCRLLILDLEGPRTSPWEP